MITIINDDITNAKRGIIAHCVNCQGKMGSGVAKALYEKWPRVKEAYLDVFTRLEFSNLEKSTLLGKVNHVLLVDSFFPGEDLSVANCFAQEFYGYDGKRYADLRELRSCLRKVATLCEDNNVPLHVPYRLASDRAGLSWRRDVYPLLIAISNNYEIDVIIWKK